MELWQQMIRDSIHTVDQLVEKFGLEKKVAEDLDEFFQARINPYYLSLIKYPGDPIWLQCVPEQIELEDYDGVEDPLNEDEMSPVPNITHRYPDRVLFLVTSQCGLYCRFCTRKRKVGDSSKISRTQQRYLQMPGSKKVPRCTVFILLFGVQGYTGVCREVCCGLK